MTALAVRVDARLIDLTTRLIVVTVAPKRVVALEACSSWKRMLTHWLITSIKDVIPASAMGYIDHYVIDSDLEHRIKYYARGALVST